MKKTKWIAATSLLILLLTVLTACASSNDKLSVNTAAAAERGIMAKSDVTGVLVPNQTVNLQSKISGTVTGLKADVGTKVTKGQTIITLDTATLNTQLQQAMASLESAKASVQTSKNQVQQAKINLNFAQAAYDRDKGLYEAGAISKVEYDNAKNNLDLVKKQYQGALGTVSGQSQAAVSAAQANINTIKSQIAQAAIKSPLTGVVTNKNINLGEVASPGINLITVTDTSQLKLKGTIQQEALPFLKVGQDINLYVDIYPNQSFSGKIDSIGPSAVGTGLYFPIEFSVQNEGGLKAGLSAHATIGMKSKAGIIIPLSAVIEDNGKSYVFVIKDNIASKRTVVTGLKNDKEIVIVKGINSGETVATSNVSNLIDKMTVTVNNEKNNEKDQNNKKD